MKAMVMHSQNDGTFSHSYKNYRLQARPGHFFTKPYFALPHDLAMSRSREIVCYSDRIALKFDRRVGSSAAEMPVNFQSDSTTLIQYLMAAKLCEIRRFGLVNIVSDCHGTEGTH